MPDKMHLEGDRKSVPLWQSPKKKVLATLNTCLGFPKPRLVPVTQGPAASSGPVTETGRLLLRN